MTTCWIALDETHADTGTIYYARGSHQWGHSRWAGSSMRRRTGPATRRGGAARAVRRGGVGADRGAAPAARRSTTAGPSTARRPTSVPDRERRAIISHMMTTETRWHPTNVHEIYSHYRRPGELEMDEAFFPIMWREDGYRSPFIDRISEPAAA